MVTVIHRQSLVSWNEQTAYPVLIIADREGEILLNYKTAKRLVRDLQETLDRIDEERKWL